jgi:hypothetical protein
MSGSGGLGSRFSGFFAPQRKPTGPVPFGFKMGWIVVKSTSSAKVVSSVGIRSPRTASWQEGIDRAYNAGLVFVSPPINDWVSVVGERLMQRNGRSSVEVISKEVVSLSSMFGEAQGFASHRVIEYQHWMLAKNGRLLRCFAYIGETGESWANTGSLTDAERRLRFFSLPQEQWQPNEQDVMAVASGWSFDPTLLTATSGSASLGVLGEL